MSCIRSLFGVLAVVILLTVISPSLASAADFTAFTVKGDALVLEIMHDGSTYIGSRLWLALAWGPNANLPFIVFCDGDGGGDLSNCKHATAFLGGPGCTIQHDVIMPSPGNTITTDVYSCQHPARRDAGECVEISGVLGQGTIFSGDSIQALEPIAATIDYVTGCSSKP